MESNPPTSGSQVVGSNLLRNKASKKKLVKTDLDLDLCSSPIYLHSLPPHQEAMRASSEARDFLAQRRHDLLVKLNQDGMRNLLVNRRNDFLIPSPIEDQKAIRTKQCTQESVRAGAKAAAIACVASAVPTLVAVRKIPWAKANINYTGQALIISAATIAAYFITADKTLLECARKNAHYKPS